MDVFICFIAFFSIFDTKYLIIKILIIYQVITIVHWDYSLIGRNFKVVIYKEILVFISTLKFALSIIFQEMEYRQSDICNKVIASIFKHIGVINQWGNGLKIISNELKDNPEIEYRWIELWLQFLAKFNKKNYQLADTQEVDIEFIGKKMADRLGLRWVQVGAKSGLSQDQVGNKSTLSRTQVEIMLVFAETESSFKELMAFLNWKNRSNFSIKYINPLLESKLLNMMIPCKPNSF